MASKRDELIAFVQSLTDEQIEKLASRLDYLKSFTDEDIKKLETVKPPKPHVVASETPLPFQKKSETAMPFQRNIKR
ncbi:MAG: hypothetical protein IJ295_01065 [Clostridia bacterium]|nr:hypothetical protein [Clostridia bacterium]